MILCQLQYGHKISYLVFVDNVKEEVGFDLCTCSYYLFFLSEFTFSNFGLFTFSGEHFEVFVEIMALKMILKIIVDEIVP